MAAPRRRVFRRGLTAPGRTTWGALVGTTANTSVAASSIVFLGNFSLDNPGINETVMRTRGLLHISSDQAAAEESQIGAFGMCVVTDQALTIGVTALPGPVSDADDDIWFVWQPIVASGAAVLSGRLGWQYEIDSKAMRRIQEGKNVALMIENASASNAFEIGLALRLLSKRM